VGADEVLTVASTLADLEAQVSRRASSLVIDAQVPSMCFPPPTLGTIFESMVLRARGRGAAGLGFAERRRLARMEDGGPTARRRRLRDKLIEALEFRQACTMMMLRRARSPRRGGGGG